MAKPTAELIPTRASLLGRLKDWRDDASWQDFVDTYRPLILHIALNAGLSRDEADDAVQETLITVAKYMPGFNYDPAIGSFKSWLFKAAKWRILDQVRKRGPLSRSISYSDDDDSSAQGGDTPRPASDQPCAQWDEDWKTHLLEAAVMRVKRRADPRQYQMFHLHGNKGWAAERVARVYRVTVGRVRKAKYQVKHMIQAEVKRLQKGVT